MARNACVWLRQIGVRDVAYRTLNLGPAKCLRNFRAREQKVTTEQAVIQMGIQKKTRKFAQVKRIIGQRDARLKKNQVKGEEKTKPKGDDVVREM